VWKLGTNAKIGVLLIVAGGYGLVTERPWGLKFGVVASVVGVVFACVEGILFYVFRFMFLELISKMGVEMTEIQFSLMTLPFPVIMAILSAVALLLCIAEIRKE